MNALRGNLEGFDFNKAREPSVIDEPVASLRARADLREIVERYTDLKERKGQLWGKCPVHAESTPSFKLNPMLQRFVCFGCKAKGDALDFLQAVEGLDFGPACDRLRELIGTTESDPAADKHRAARQAEAKANEERDKARRRANALAVWRASEPLPWHIASAGQRYLREERGITSWLPNVVRWHPACPWTEGKTAGCIVVPIHDPAGDVMGIHRIRPDAGDGTRRMVLGTMAGGACRLFDAAAEVLIITEGVEDALAARQIAGWPAWATINAGNMGALVLPPPDGETCKEIHIFADADVAGLKGAHSLAARLLAEGRDARVYRPQAAKDPNAVLLARGAA